MCSYFDLDGRASFRVEICLDHFKGKSKAKERAVLEAISHQDERDVMLTQFQLVIAGGMSYIEDSWIGGCTSVCDQSPYRTSITYDKDWPSSRFCNSDQTIEKYESDVKGNIENLAIPIKRHFWKKLQWSESKVREKFRSFWKKHFTDEDDPCIVNTGDKFFSFLSGRKKESESPLQYAPMTGGN